MQFTLQQVSAPETKTSFRLPVYSSKPITGNDDLGVILVELKVNDPAKAEEFQKKIGKLGALVAGFFRNQKRRLTFFENGCRVLGCHSLHRAGHFFCYQHRRMEGAITNRGPGFIEQFASPTLRIKIGK